MANGNETALRLCRFLSEDYYPELYEAFLDAFSDYVIPFALTDEQFRNHIMLNAVDLARTAGYFEDGRLVGFSLTGFGRWNGKLTAYDAGTGVVPDRRRRGLSDAMFKMMLPVFEENGIEQFLLEVVTTNTRAINLYKKLDFQTIRDLALLQCDGNLHTSAAPSQDIQIRDFDDPDWEHLTTFWDGAPSWQNSVEAVIRSQKMKRICGAFLDGKCVGYIVFSSKFGRVAQIAVDKNYRTRGIGTALVRNMHAKMADGFSMQVINIDKSLTTAMGFFLNLGFYERLSQHEMVKTM